MIEYAFSVLAARSLPEKKLRERLVARYPAAEVDAALTRLRGLCIIDDERWAELYAWQRFQRGGMGRHRIRAELVARGIHPSTADAAVANFRDDVEHKQATKVLDAMRRRLSRGSSCEFGAHQTEAAEADESPHSQNAADDAVDQRQRLFRRMIARGWPASLVRDLLDVS